MPARPPKFDELLAGLSYQEMLQLHARGAQEELSAGYLHWDKLRRLTPPPDLAHPLWWLSLKLHRTLRVTPLRDKAGQHFKLARPAQLDEYLHEIDLGAGGRIEVANPIANPEAKDRYYIDSLINEAITSSQLEGAHTTRRVAKEMLRRGRPPRDRSEQMILNNFVTMRQIGQWKSELLTPQRVLELHALVTEATLDNTSAAGRLRTAEEAIRVEDQYGEVFHDPPAADELPERLDALCSFANGATPDSFLHPVIRAILLHFWLAYDHPFVDGNGRTARALFYWAMLRNGYWLFEYVSISQIILKAPLKYARAFLYTETDDNDLTYFVLYHLEVIRRSVAALHTYLARKQSELQALETRLRGMDDLNYRQRALMSHALRRPNFRYTVESHQRSHNVVYETARSDLLDLQRRDLVHGRKRGRRWEFTAPSDLEERLARDPDS